MEEHIIGKTIHENIKTMIKNKNLKNYSILRLALEIEIEIIKLGNNYSKYKIKCAFPTGININDVVAHYTPCKKDKTILNSGDVCKIDYGISVDGYIYDGAFTVYIFKEDDTTDLYTDELIHKLKEQWNTSKLKIVLELIDFLLNHDMNENIINNIKSLETIIHNMDENTNKIITEYYKIVI